MKATQGRCCGPKAKRTAHVNAHAAAPSRAACLAAGAARPEVCASAAAQQQQPASCSTQPARPHERPQAARFQPAVAASAAAVALSLLAPVDLSCCGQLFPVPLAGAAMASTLDGTADEAAPAVTIMAAAPPLEADAARELTQPRPAAVDAVSKETPTLEAPLVLASSSPPGAAAAAAAAPEALQPAVAVEAKLQPAVAAATAAADVGSAAGAATQPAAKPQAIAMTAAAPSLLGGGAGGGSSGGEATAEPLPVAKRATAAGPLGALSAVDDLPAESLGELVRKLVANERFIAALVTDDSFLDQLADNKTVLKAVQKKNEPLAAVREGVAQELEVRQERLDELAQELGVRQEILGELKSRGQAAVIAVADKARAAIDAVAASPGPTGKEVLMKLETAMELLEDSRELMMAVEGREVGSEEPSGAIRFMAIEAPVAAQQQRLVKVLKEESQGDTATLAAELRLQEAIKELYTMPADARDVDSAIDSVFVQSAEVQGKWARALASAASKLNGLGEAAKQGIEVTTNRVGGKEQVNRTLIVVPSVVLMGYCVHTFRQAIPKPKPKV